MSLSIFAGVLDTALYSSVRTGTGESSVHTRTSSSVRRCKSWITQATMYALLLLLLCSHVTMGMYTRSDVKEFCQFDSFVAECQDDEVVLITSAQYGRMGKGQCIQGEGYIGCSHDVVGFIDSQCSGLRRCEVKVVTLAEVVQPCRKDFISYLEASYTCIKVVTSPSCGQPLEAPSGHLPSLAALEGGGGSMRCPWRIQASPGQKIQLSAALFGTVGTVDVKDNNKCLIRVVIQETTSITQTLCGFSRHSRVIYTSTSNNLQLYFIIDTSPEVKPAFLVTYTVQGCPDVHPPANTIMKRTGTDLIIRCNHTKETWFLTCKENRWAGEMGNCTSPRAEEQWGVDNILGTEISLPHGLIIAIPLGILLGVLIGFVSLGVLIMYRKRQLRHVPPPPPPPSGNRSKRLHPSPGGTATYGIYPHNAPPRRAHVYETPRVPGERQTYFELDSEQHMSLHST